MSVSRAREHHRHRIQLSQHRATQSELATALKPAIAPFEDTLSPLVAEAALAVMLSLPKNYNVDSTCARGQNYEWQLGGG